MFAKVGARLYVVEGLVEAGGQEQGSKVEAGGSRGISYRMRTSSLALGSSKVRWRRKMAYGGYEMEKERR